MCLALLASGLWLRYTTLQNLIPSFPYIAPHALHPGAIQGKEGIKFCHLATLFRNGGRAPSLREESEEEDSDESRASSRGGGGRTRGNSRSRFGGTRSQTPGPRGRKNSNRRSRSSSTPRGRNASRSRRSSGSRSETPDSGTSSPRDEIQYTLVTSYDFLIWHWTFNFQAFLGEFKCVELPLATQVSRRHRPGTFRGPLYPRRDGGQREERYSRIPRGTFQAGLGRQRRELATKRQEAQFNTKLANKEHEAQGLRRPLRLARRDLRGREAAEEDGRGRRRGKEIGQNGLDEDEGVPVGRERRLGLQGRQPGLGGRHRQVGIVDGVEFGPQESSEVEGVGEREKAGGVGGSGQQEPGVARHLHE